MARVPREVALCLLCLWVIALICLPKVRSRHMGVDLCGVEIPMTEQVRNAKDVRRTILASR
jgi:hypothetical protein